MNRIRYFYENKNFYILRCSDLGLFIPKSKINWVIGGKKTYVVRSLETSALNYDGTSSVFVPLFLFFGSLKEKYLFAKNLQLFEILDCSVLAFDVLVRIIHDGIHWMVFTDPCYNLCDNPYFKITSTLGQTRYNELHGTGHFCSL